MITEVTVVVVGAGVLETSIAVVEVSTEDTEIETDETVVPRGSAVESSVTTDDTSDELLAIAEVEIGVDSDDEERVISAVVGGVVVEKVLSAGIGDVENSDSAIVVVVVERRGIGVVVEVLRRVEFEEVLVGVLAGVQGLRMET